MEGGRGVMTFKLISKLIFFSFCCALGLAVILAGPLTPPTTPMIHQYDRTENYITIKVRLYDDKESLYKSWLEDGGHALPVGSALNGWSSIPAHSENPCTIHVTDIKYLEDRATMTTWGHELGHCIYGSFHK